MDLTPFKKLIKERCGFTCDGTRELTLANSIRCRMAQEGIASHNRYLLYLLNNDDEFRCLVNLLTINETYFFREPAHLEMLPKLLLPKMLQTHNSGTKIRILSAGCSTGEEAYSIVMSFMEKYGAEIRNLIKVIGTDIDSEAIGRAIKGIYYKNSFRALSDNLQEKYFEATGINYYKIKDFVKENVEFKILNLLSDDYQKVLGKVDVIFYRNVSIYFEPDIQKSIFKKLAGLLNDGGHLFVSATETMSHNIGILPLVEIDNVFLFSKDIKLIKEPKPYLPLSHASRFSYSHAARVTDPAVRTAISSESATVQAQTITRESPAHALFDEAVSLAQGKHYSEALKKVNEIIKLDECLLKAYVLKANILINLKHLEEAKKACMDIIGTDRWCLEGYLLLGMIARMQNDEGNAIRRFKEAIYIQSSSWLAHFYLAEIYKSRGETEMACREYEIVARLLKNGKLPDHGSTFSPLSFSTEHIAHLCNHNLKGLRRRAD